MIGQFLAPGSPGATTSTAGITQQTSTSTGLSVSSYANAVGADFGNIAQRWLAREHVGFDETGLGVGQFRQSSALLPENSSLASRLPTARDEPRRVWALKKWSGQILEIADDLLTVELTPLDHAGPTFQVDFDSEILSPGDEVARPGDIVYVTATTTRRSGYNRVTTELRLRRTGTWSEKELDEIEGLAKRRAERFKQIAG